MWFFCCAVCKIFFNGLNARFALAYVAVVIHFVHNSREGLTVRFTLAYIGVVIHTRS